MKITILLIALLLTACSPRMSAESLPTVAVLPSLTPIPATLTETPIPTLPPTDTPQPPTVTPAPSDTPEIFTGQWELVTNTSALTDVTEYTLGLPASELIQTWVTRTRPFLLIRCDTQNRGYEVVVAADAQLDSNLDDQIFVQYRIDDGNIESGWMNVSTNNEGIFFPMPLEMVIALVNAEQLIVAFAPFETRVQEAIFDLRGLWGALQPLETECRGMSPSQAANVGATATPK